MNTMCSKVAEMLVINDCKWIKGLEPNDIRHWSI